MKIIDTRYNGHHFRSRLEARWAVFMDTLNIGFRYEHEGFDLNGVWYLPDFWLPTLDVWIEIKPVEPDALARLKAERLAVFTQRPVYIFSGPVRAACDLTWYQSSDKYAQASVWFPRGGDIHYLWCECSSCGSVGIEFDGRSDRLICKEALGCPRSAHGDKGYNYDSPRLLSAYTVASEMSFLRAD